MKVERFLADRIVNDPRRISDELLSAYSDGETSPEESAAVEALLAESEAAREQRGDFQRLSSLLNAGFSTADLSVDLVASTLQRVETSRIATPSAVNPNPFRREWLAALSAIAVSAATLVLVVRSNPHDAPLRSNVLMNSEAMNSETMKQAGHSAEVAMNSPRESDVASNGIVPEEFSIRSDQPGTLRAKVALEPDIHAEKKPGRSVAPQSEVAVRQRASMREANQQPNLVKRDDSPKAAAADATPSAASSSAASKPPASAAPVNSPPGKQPAGQNAGGVSASNLATLAGQNRLRVGDVVPYLATTDGNTVGIVELTVVDIDRTVGEISVLLQQNTVPENKLAESKELAARKGTAMALADKSGATAQLQALYLEASSEQLRVAFNEMDDRGLLLNARLQPPITAEEVSYANGWNEQSANQLHSLDAISVGNTVNYRLNSPANDVSANGSPSQAVAQNSPPPAPLSTPAPASVANADQLIPLQKNSTSPLDAGSSSNDLKVPAGGGRMANSTLPNDSRAQSANGGYFQRLELQLNRRDEAGKNSGFNVADRSRGLNDGSRQSAFLNNSVSGTNSGNGSAPGLNSSNALGVGNFAGNRVEGQKMHDMVRMVLLLQKQSR